MQIRAPALAAVQKVWMLEVSDIPNSTVPVGMLCLCCYGIAMLLLPNKIDQEVVVFWLVYKVIQLCDLSILITSYQIRQEATTALWE